MNPIIILNAPPRVGKDTVASHFTGNMIIENTTCFKYPMLEIASTTMGMSYPVFLKKYTDNVNNWKDTPLFELNGHTVRELLIRISETFIKPFFDDAYFGRYIAEKIFYSGREDQPWIIPDGGFQAEVDALVEKFGERVVVIQMAREGHRDFTGDSRGWVMGPTTHFIDTSNGNEKVINLIHSLLNE